MGKRIAYFDVLKALAILLVIYTHCLQFLGVGNYWHHPLFKFSYAFHMPLFMLVSGYFASHAMQLPVKQLISKEFKHLLLPCISAGVAVVAFNQVFELIDGHSGLLEFIFNLWYLKSLFLCLLIAKFTRYCCKGNNSLSCPLAILIALPIYIYHVNFMMPFFCLGVLWNQHRDVVAKYSKIIFILSVIFFAALWPFWDGVYTTYATPLQFIDFHPLQFSVTVNWSAYLFRLVMGLAGVGMAITLIHWIMKKNIRLLLLQRLGQYTLELYTIHFFFIHTGLLAACAVNYRPGWYEFGYCIFVSIGLIIISFAIMKGIYRSSCLSVLFFGKSNLSTKL